MVLPGAEEKGEILVDGFKTSVNKMSTFWRSNIQHGDYGALPCLPLEAVCAFHSCVNPSALLISGERSLALMCHHPRSGWRKAGLGLSLGSRFCIRKRTYTPKIRLRAALQS